MADDIDTEIAEIEDSMADDFAGYSRDPAKQERYGALLEAQESGTPAPDQPDAAAVRKGALETMMRDQRSPYWKGSQSDRLQAEYRDLLGAERPAADQGESATPPHQTDAVQVSDGDVDNALSNLKGMGAVGAAWAEDLGRGGAKGALGVMEDTRRAIMAGFGDQAADIALAFESNLSAVAQAAAYREMASPFAERQPDASQDELARFRETRAGQILAAEWRDATARNLSRALFRWDRMGMDLEDADADQLDDMYQRLTTAEKTVVTRFLGQ